MYNNIGKRDILIFPKFNNIDLIQKIREKYDVLANLVPPHITLAFPFRDDISDEELILKLQNLLKNFSTFDICFKGVSLSNNNYIFLNCIKGNEYIYQLHDEIYEKIIPSHFKKEIQYIPHITLGQADNIDDLRDFDFEFSTKVTEISIELVGNNEESIIVGTLKLKD